MAKVSINDIEVKRYDENIYGLFVKGNILKSSSKFPYVSKNKALLEWIKDEIIQSGLKELEIEESCIKNLGGENSYVLFATQMYYEKSPIEYFNEPDFTYLLKCDPILRKLESYELKAAAGDLIKIIESLIEEIFAITSNEPDSTDALHRFFIYFSAFSIPQKTVIMNLMAIHDNIILPILLIVNKLSIDQYAQYMLLSDLFRLLAEDEEEPRGFTYDKVEHRKKYFADAQACVNYLRCWEE